MFKNQEGNGDIVLVAIILLLGGIYGTFIFLYGSGDVPGTTGLARPEQNYTVPESTGLWDSLTGMISLNLEQPEIFFMNTIVFGTLATLLVLVVLRFLRGQ
jgi:hypothetical protein